MNRYTKYFTIIFISISSLLFFGGSSFAQAENRSENVKNTVSATANTGGNKIEGNGTIKTGDATASVKAQNYVNGGENVENKAEAKAEGNTASVKVNGEEKSCEGGEGEICSVELGDSFAEVGESPVEPEIIEPEEKETEKNFVEKIAGALEEFTGNIIKGIRGWLS